MNSTSLSTRTNELSNKPISHTRQNSLNDDSLIINFHQVWVLVAIWPTEQTHWSEPNIRSKKKFYSLKDAFGLRSEIGVVLNKPSQAHHVRPIKILLNGLTLLESWRQHPNKESNVKPNKPNEIHEIIVKCWWPLCMLPAQTSPRVSDGISDIFVLGSSHNSNKCLVISWFHHFGQFGSWFFGTWRNYLGG